MELLLNLAWVLLALPAYWLWRVARAGGRRSISSLQCLSALGCALVLLFPVISASDDLHAMRAEMEDSSFGKRAVRQAASDKRSAWVNRLQSPPAMAVHATWAAVHEIGLLDVPRVSSMRAAWACAFHAGRAPPFPSLG